MSDTKIRAPRAPRMLEADHQRVKTLFSEYEEFGDDSTLTKQAIFDQIQRELLAHTQVEEEVFYPAVADQAALGEVLDEHRVLKELLAELSQLAPDRPEFDIVMQALEESLDRHSDKEENEIFPLFDTLDPERQDVVSEAVRRRKTELSGGADWES
jgi:hemerythrin superfamily protein